MEKIFPKNNKKEQNELLSCRQILWIFAFTGMTINYSNSQNINIAIVDMLKLKTVPHAMNTSLENSKELNSTTSMGISTTKKSYLSPERAILDILQIDYERNGFDWDEKQQNLVLGSFFWTHWITQFFAGSITRRLGPKFVYGVGNLMGGILFALMPIAAYLNINALLVLRLIQGLIMGPCWPAMHQLASNWIPPNERSKFMSSYLGTAVGLIVLYPIFGYIMSRFCWEWVFHITVILTILWYCGWEYLIYDTPARHPRIHSSERYLIEESLSDEISMQSQKLPIPWMRMLSSTTVWSTIIGLLGSIWVIYTMLAQGPTYFKTVHNWDIESMGFVTGLPHIFKFFFGIGLSVVFDHLLTSGKLSKTNVRKCAVLISNSLAGVLLILLAYLGNNPKLAPVFYTLVVVTNGAMAPGVMAGIIDIAPNFAGTLMGVAGCIGIMPGFISPYVVGVLTYNANPTDGWRNVFLISGIIALISGFPYLILGDMRVRSWNNARRRTLEYIHRVRSMSFSRVRTVDVVE